MPKIAQSDLEKAKRHVIMYPKEFEVDQDGKLFCKLCRINVSVVKTFRVTSHRSSMKHRRYLSNATGISLPDSYNNYQSGVRNAFDLNSFGQNESFGQSDSLSQSDSLGQNNLLSMNLLGHSNSLVKMASNGQNNSLSRINQIASSLGQNHSPSQISTSLNQMNALGRNHSPSQISSSLNQINSLGRNGSPSQISSSINQINSLGQNNSSSQVLPFSQIISQPPIQNGLFNQSEPSLASSPVVAFLAAGIPLKKLKHPMLGQFFDSIDNPLPNDDGMRREVTEVYHVLIQKICNLVRGHQVFLIIGESTIGSSNYVSALIGCVDNPKTVYLVYCKQMQSALNIGGYCCIINHVLGMLKIPNNQLLMLISEGTSDIPKADKDLSSFYPKLIHLESIDGLLHDAAVEVRANCEDVNNLIASVQAAIIADKSLNHLFYGKDIPVPPLPMDLNWGSWLNSTMYYAEHLPVVRRIFELLDDSNNDILVANAKKALENETAARSLEWVNQYAALLNMSEELGTVFTIEKALEKIPGLDFQDDVCNIKPRIDEKLEKNGFNDIRNKTNTSLSPADYAALYKCPATSIRLENSFSMLGELVMDDDSPLDLAEHLICQFNSFLLN